MKTASQRADGATFIVQKVEMFAMEEVNFVVSALHSVQELLLEVSVSSGKYRDSNLRQKC